MGSVALILFPYVASTDPWGCDLVTAGVVVKALTLHWAAKYCHSEEGYLQVPQVEAQAPDMASTDMVDGVSM